MNYKIDVEILDFMIAVCHGINRLFRDILVNKLSLRFLVRHFVFQWTQLYRYLWYFAFIIGHFMKFMKIWLQKWLSAMDNLKSPFAIQFAFIAKLRSRFTNIRLILHHYKWLKSFTSTHVCLDGFLIAQNSSVR